MAKDKNAFQTLTSFFLTLIKSFIRLNKGVFQAFREQSVESLEQQKFELENAFLNLVLGGLVGVPLVPTAISKELLPLLAEEIKILEHRAFLGADTYADLFSTLGGEW